MSSQFLQKIVIDLYFTDLQHFDVSHKLAYLAQRLTLNWSALTDIQLS